MLSSFLTGCTWGDCAFQVEHRLEWLHKITKENIKRYYYYQKKRAEPRPTFPPWSAADRSRCNQGRSRWNLREKIRKIEDKKIYGNKRWKTTNNDNITFVAVRYIPSDQPARLHNPQQLGERLRNKTWDVNKMKLSFFPPEAQLTQGTCRHCKVEHRKYRSRSGLVCQVSRRRRLSSCIGLESLI